MIKTKFNLWNNIRQKTENKKAVFCKLWEIWMANIWKNIWDEEDWIL